MPRYYHNKQQREADGDLVREVLLPHNGHTVVVLYHLPESKFGQRIDIFGYAASKIAGGLGKNNVPATEVAPIPKDLEAEVAELAWSNGLEGPVVHIYGSIYHKTAEGKAEQTKVVVSDGLKFLADFLAEDDSDDLDLGEDE